MPKQATPPVSQTLNLLWAPIVTATAENSINPDEGIVLLYSRRRTLQANGPCRILSQTPRNRLTTDFCDRSSIQDAIQQWLTQPPRQ